MGTLNLDQHDGIIHAILSGEIDETEIDDLEPNVERLMANNNASGIMVEADKFDGWSDFPAFVRHMEFIRDHHAAIKKVAVIGEGPWRDALSAIARMIQDTEIRFFTRDRVNEAENWLTVTNQKEV